MKKIKANEAKKLADDANGGDIDISSGLRDVYLIIEDRAKSGSYSMTFVKEHYVSPAYYNALKEELIKDGFIVTDTHITW